VHEDSACSARQGCDGKRPFFTMLEAGRVARGNEGGKLEVYECPLCFCWHLECDGLDPSLSCT